MSGKSKRRKRSSAEKLRIVLAGMDGTIEISELCRRGGSGERYNAVFKRIYRLKEEDRKKGDSGWRETDSIGRDDLLLLAKVADLAHTWMFEQTESAKKSA